MRHISEIMAELGFKKDSSEEVQKAFIMNLIRQAKETERVRPVALKPVNEKLNHESEPAQLSLFDDNGSSSFGKKTS